MPTPTYDLLETTIVGTATPSVSFSGLGDYSSYRDLAISIDVTTSASSDLFMRFNGSSADYRFFDFSGNGSTTSTDQSTSRNGINFNELTNTDPNDNTLIIVDLFDFYQTDKNKAVLNRVTRPGSRISFQYAAWANTSAITSIEFSVASGNINANTSISIYGVVA